ncbi:Aldehyde dehydrogenase, C-terminal [Phytophthora cactorum]|nr:Aldehyde dehydrogenase, C-terminal [Phytophthora cactorum]
MEAVVQLVACTSAEDATAPLRWPAAVEKHMEALSRLETTEALDEPVRDMEDVAGCFQYYAEALDKRQYEMVDLPLDDIFKTIRYEPLAPPLAAGCTVVLEPSDLTPLTALERWQALPSNSDQKLVLGDPLYEKAQMGPLALHWLKAYYRAVARDISCRPRLSRTSSEPVQSVMTFKTKKEAVTLANDSEFGLAAAVFTSDDAQLKRMTKYLRAGFKSGFGRELSPFGLNSYLAQADLHLRR